MKGMNRPSVKVVQKYDNIPLTNSKLGGGTKPYKIRAKATFDNISS